MKKSKRLALGLAVALVMTAGAPVVPAEAASTASSVKKSGLQKVKGKYYYYKKGKKIKNTWKTIKKARYYFGRNGAAYTGVKKIKGKYYYFSNTGKLQKKKWVKNKTYYAGSNGVLYTGLKKVGSKLYYFNANGKKNKTRSLAIQRACQYGKDFEALKALIGEPKKSTYTYSCMGAGDDGILTYSGFTVYTYRDTDGSEIVTGIS